MVKFLVLLLLAFPLQARELASDDINTCEVIAEKAKSIMEVRQVGAPMQEVMDAVKDSAIKSLYFELVIQAYERPRYQSDEFRRRAVVDFQNEWYLSCVKAMKS